MAFITLRSFSRSFASTIQFAKSTHRRRKKSAAVLALTLVAACGGGAPGSSTLEHSSSVGPVAPERVTIHTALAGNRCVDVIGQSTDNGTGVQIWDCWGGMNQAWNVGTDGTIRGIGGKCLDANIPDHNPADATNGTPVQIYDCWGGANQNWTLTAAGEIRLTGTNKCLDVPNQTGAGGAALWLWDCWGGTNQHWTTNDASQAVAANPSSIDFGETKYGDVRNATASMVAPYDGNVYAYFENSGTFNARFMVQKITSFKWSWILLGGRRLPIEVVDQTATYGGRISVHAGQRIEVAFSFTPQEDDAGIVYFNDKVRVHGDYWYAEIPASARVTLLGSGGAIVPGIFDHNLTLSAGTSQSISFSDVNIGPARNVSFVATALPGGVTMQPVTQLIGDGALGQVTLTFVANASAPPVSGFAANVEIRPDGRGPQEIALGMTVQVCGIEGQPVCDGNKCTGPDTHPSVISGTQAICTAHCGHAFEAACQTHPNGANGTPTWEYICVDGNVFDGGTNETGGCMCVQSSYTGSANDSGSWVCDSGTLNGLCQSDKSKSTNPLCK
jgi:hypothetical protein